MDWGAISIHRMILNSQAYGETLDHARAPRHCLFMTQATESIDDNLNFEDALKALEAIVHKLESGEAPLDESIALYERGHALRLLCQKRLDSAKARIDMIVAGRDGAPAGMKPFPSE